METLDDQVMNISQRTVIDALETCKVDHNKAFIKGALRNAPNSLLISILKNESGIRESSEFAIVQVATSLNFVSKIFKAIVTDAAILAPIAKVVEQAVRSEAAESSRESMTMTLRRPRHRGLCHRLTRRMTARSRAQELNIVADRRYQYRQEGIPCHWKAPSRAWTF